MIIFGLFFILTFQFAKSVDCVYDPKNRSSNCLLYCSENYSGIPQRRYYNKTTQNCQHMNSCPPILGTTYYYDYAKNLCFDSIAQKKIIQSPPDHDNKIKVNLVDDNNFICLRGSINLMTATNTLICICQLFWKDSGKLNNIGVPYKCDMVQTNLSKVFKNITVKNGVITNYDKYSAEEAEIMLKNALSIQQQSSLQIARHNQVTIQFQVSALPQDPYISAEQLYIVYFCLLSIALLIALTIYEHYHHKIKVTKQIFEKRLYQIIRERK